MKHQRQGENAIGVDSLCKSTRLTTSQRLGNVLPKTWAKRSWRPQQKAVTTLGSTVRIGLGNGKVVLATGILSFTIENRPPSKQRTDNRSKCSNQMDRLKSIAFSFFRNEGSKNLRNKPFPKSFNGKKNVNFRVIPFDPDGAYCYRIGTKSCKSRRLVRLANCSVTRR